jgi:hypothetical protein
VFVQISEQTAKFALYIINCLVFITVVKRVYTAVRTDFLYKADYISSLKVETTINGPDKIQFEFKSGK